MLRTGTAFGRLRDARRLARPAGGPALISPSAIGSTNLGRVLQALYDFGPTSRAELARKAGVNRTTITGIVQPLIDEGILVEGEPLAVAGTGGKPARPLCFNPEGPVLGGILLMPELVQSALMRLDGTLLAEHRTPLSPAMDAAGILAATVATFERSLAGARVPPLGIGVAVGGMVDADKGVIVKINLAPALDGFRLGEALSGRFGVPAYLDHHPRAMLVGDRWFGHGRAQQRFAAIYTGEVLGGALYLDGRVHRGPAGAGGELGHTFVDYEGEICRCGRRGCWETIAALPWLRAEAARRGLPDAGRMAAEPLSALADGGDDTAAALRDRYARNIAVGIANLQQTMAPNRFILHGDVVGGGQALTGLIGAHVRDLVPERPGCELSFVMGGMARGQAAVRGAAGLVLSDYLQFPL